MYRSAIAAFAAAITFGFFSNYSSAADYPTRPVTIVVPAPPGGNVDRVARVIAPKLSEIWAQPVVVENIAGAANIIGTRNVIHAAPDGYRLLMGSLGPNILTPLAMRHVGQDPGYDPKVQLTPIVNLTSQAFLLLVRAESPYKTLNDLIADMRVNGNALDYATSGYGTVSHFATEVFKKEVGGELTHVPYGGDAQAQMALLSGEADLYFTVTSTAAALLESGKVRALMVTAPERSKRAPDALSFAEAGLQGPDLQIWIGLFGPAGMPKEIVDKINADAQTALQDPQVKKAIENGQEVFTGDVQSYDNFLNKQFESFSKNIDAINFRPNE